jgi:predicted dehydrogenase
MKVLQVGLGSWGLDWVRNVLVDNDDVDVVALVDVDGAALEPARALLAVPEARCYTAVSAALAGVEADAVLVTAALPAHAPVIRAAMEAGLDVLVEKPFASSVAEGRELVALAEARGRTLMVSQNYRFYPAVRAAVDVVRGGELGAVRSVELDFRKLSVAGPAARHRRYAQPLLVDMSVHHFDLLRLVLGREPRTVACHAWNRPESGFVGPPEAFATLVFEGDTPVSYRGTWLSRGEDTPWAGEWRMELERGELRWTSRGKDVDERVEIRPEGAAPRAVPLPTLAHIGRRGTLHEFATAVAEGRTPDSSGRENLGTLALIEAAVASADAGGVPAPHPAD